MKKLAITLFSLLFAASTLAAVTTAKPEPHSINSGATHYPSHLWVMAEGSGSTVEDEGGGGDYDLTITGADWATGTLGSQLDFVAANSDIAKNTSVSGESGTQTMCVVVRSATTNTAMVNMQLAEAADSDSYARFYFGTDGDLTGQADHDAAAAITNASDQVLDNDTWHLACARFSETAVDLSVDGAAWEADSSGTLTGLMAALNCVSVGGECDSSPSQYMNGSIAAAMWWEGSKSDADISAIYNSGDPWSVIGVDEGASPPSFSVSPTVSATSATSYTLSYTPSASATFYVVACSLGESTPSSTQLKAGQCGSGAAAAGSASEAVTGADTTVVGSLKWPRHDLYALLSNAGGNSSIVTLSDQERTADTGQQIVALTSISATSVFDTDSYYNPDVAAGDIVEIDLVTDPGGYDITLGADGDIEIDAGGDTSRQLINYCVQDASGASGDFTTPSCWTTDDVIAIGNQSPVCEDSITRVFHVGDAMPTVDLHENCLDPEGDAITCALTSGTLPTGITLTGADCTLTGTPTVENESGAAVTFTVTDQYGATATQDYTIYPIDTIAVPDCSGLSAAACASAVQTAFLSDLTVFRCSALVAENYVVSTSPIAGSEAEPGATVTITASLGATCPVYTGVTIPNHFYQLNKPIYPIDFSAYVQESAYPIESCEFRTFTGGTPSTTANGAGSSSASLVMTSATGFVAGDWVKIGASTYRRILSIAGSTATLEQSASWADGAALVRQDLTVTTVPGLSWGGSNGCTLSGTPTSAGSSANLLIRVTDSNGGYVDIP